jgi:di/tripeptidase
MINKNTLKEVLSIPSYYEHEELVRDYIIGFAESNNLDYYLDGKGNLYITKGVLKEGEYYPCVVAHMDTVHRDQHTLIKENKRLLLEETITGDKSILIAKNPDTKQKTGIGGDDKCGVYLCLEMLLKRDCLKASFFVCEEIGMLGSKECDPNFFNDVGYAIQFDAPTGNWFSISCNGINLWNEEFGSVVTPLLESNNITNFSYDPFTDVVQLKKKFDFCCSVLFSGYYRQHTKDEYVVVEDVEKSFNVANVLMDSLGYRKYHMLYQTREKQIV